ncbi:MAG TPA: hypothetical protein VK694_02975 [Verrucomicrobiae bacterium]|nr:hypothetical protein [Verrucomicrobiae bacterium]
MSRLCETCPLRGDACDELEEAIFSPYGIAVRGILSGNINVADVRLAGVLVDEDRNASLPIRPGYETAESLTEKIDACNEPDIYQERHLLILKRGVPVCPALGHLAVTDRATYNVVVENPPAPIDRGSLRIPLGNTAGTGV